MRYPVKCLLLGSMLVGPAMASCFYSPTGSNTATGIYPSADATGAITLVYQPQNSAAAKVTFAIEGQSLAIPESDSTGGFVAKVDATKLAPGVYIIDCTEDTGATGHLTLIVPIGQGTDGVASGASGAASAAPASGASAPATGGTPAATPAGTPAASSFKKYKK